MRSPSPCAALLGALLAIAAAPLAAQKPHHPPKRSHAAAKTIAKPRTEPVDTAPALPPGLRPPPMLHEMRAEWIVTVANGNWPSRQGLDADSQKAELRAILDTAAALHMNAVIFQIRPGADALYESKLEPWSHVLTGVQGRAPSPYYDPLAFAIEEAHKRGLELHAWFNPFRVYVPNGDPSQAAKTLVLRKHPSWVKRYGPWYWMDPSRPEVRERALAVITDVVKRYDVDGVHIDDYFYPYRENGPNGRELDFPDAAEYKRYRRHGGRLSRDDWRRHNVDLFVQAYYARVKKAKKRVLVGVSPFGIWRPGNPPSVWGLDSYQEIYADAKLWLNRGWMDYIAPQLYWRADAPKQPYVDLLQWWIDQDTHHRHVWPGLYTGHVGMSGSAMWTPDEITREVELTRMTPGASGVVHFDAGVFMKNPQRLDSVVRQLYADVALVPQSPWLDSTPPARPILTRGDSLGTPLVILGVRRDKPRPFLWTIRTRKTTGWRTEIVPGDARTHAVVDFDADYVYVTAVDRLGNESAGAVLRIR